MAPSLPGIDVKATTREEAARLLLFAEEQFRGRMSILAPPLRVELAQALRDLALEALPIDQGRGLALLDVADLVRPRLGRTLS